MSASDTVEESESDAPYDPRRLSKSPPKLSQLQRAASSTPTKRRPSSRDLLHSSDLDQDTDSNSWQHNRLSRISLDRLRLGPQRRPSVEEQPAIALDHLAPLSAYSPGRFTNRRGRNQHQTESTSSSTLVDPEPALDPSPAKGRKIKSTLDPGTPYGLAAAATTATTTGPSRHGAKGENSVRFSTMPQQQADASSSGFPRHDLSASARIHDTFDRVLRQAAQSPPSPSIEKLHSTSATATSPLKPAALSPGVRRRASDDEFGRRASTRLRDYYADDSEDADAPNQSQDKSIEAVAPIQGPSKPLGETPARSRLWRRSTIIDSPATPHLPGFLQSTPARPQSAPLSSSTPRDPPPSIAKTPRFPGAYQHTTTPAPTNHNRWTKGKEKVEDEAEDEEEAKELPGSSPHLGKHAVDGLSQYLHRVRQRSLSEELQDPGPSSQPAKEEEEEDMAPSARDHSVRFASEEADGWREVKQESRSEDEPGSLHERLRRQRASQQQRRLSRTSEEPGTKPPAKDTFAPDIIQAEQLDAELRSRADEIRQTVEEVGARLSAKLSDAVGLTLKRDAKRRMRWLLFALLGELVLLLAIFGAAMARARQEYLSSYYDPFAPHMHSYPTASLPMSRSDHFLVSAETLALFPPPQNNNHHAPPGYATSGNAFESTMHSVLEWAAKYIVSTWASSTWDTSDQSLVMPT